MCIERDLDQMPWPAQTASEKLMAALEMHDVGVALQTEKFKSKFPEASKCELDRRLSDWLARKDED